MTSKAAFTRPNESFNDSFDYYSDHETTLLDTLPVESDYSTAFGVYHDQNIVTVFADHASDVGDAFFLAQDDESNVDAVFTPVDHQTEALADGSYMQEYSREWDPTGDDYVELDEYNELDYYVEEGHDDEDLMDEPLVHEFEMTSIPQDIGTQETVRDIIARQFDLEIANRNRELQIIEHRIAQGEWLMEQLDQAWNNRGSASTPTIVEAGTKRKKEKTKKKTKRTKKPKKKKISKPSLPSYSVFSRRPDGAFVQLICPRCRRSRFKDQLGFVNHCRIMHKLKFSSYAEAALQCGIPVDESVVPLDDPCRKMERTVKNKMSLSTSETTRFYVKKRITVGNTSKRLPPNENEGDRSTHKWTVFITGPDDDVDLRRYVRKVVFFLHPDFKPNNVIEVDSPPFQLTRRGWGEFPLRLQLHFVDRRNKPKDIIHSLKLDKSNTRDDIVVAETPATLELDRRFFSDDEIDRPPPSPPTLTNNIDVNGNVIPAPQVTSRMFDEYMRAAVRHYPLVSIRPPAKLSYSYAPSDEQWNSWNLGKRRSSEWQRARQVRGYLRRKLGLDKSTKEVVYWCRENGYTPEKHFRKKYHRATLFCKHCGVAHTPQQDFIELERACGASISGRHPLNTSSTAEQAFSFLDPSATFEVSEDVDVDILGIGPGFAPPDSPEEDKGELVLDIDDPLPSVIQYSGEFTEEYHSTRPEAMNWVRECMEDTAGIMPLESSTKESRVVESLLFKTACNFATDLVQKSLQEVKRQPDTSTDPVLVPYHVFLGSNVSETFDFLSNKGMQDLQF